MKTALLAIFLTSATCLVLALTGHGISFRLLGTRVSVESAWRLAVITGLAGLAWLVLLARRREHRDTAHVAAHAPLDARSRRWVFASLAILACAFALACIALRWTPPAYPIGDAAALELGTLNALHGEQYVGPYSRFGWNHPGPLLFYLLAPGYRLAGLRDAALYIGASGVNLLALVAMAWTAARHRAVFLSIGLTVLLTLYVVRCSPLVADAWNPYVVILPSAALLLLASSVAVGDSLALPLLALVASFVGQSHIGLLPFAAVVSAVAMVAWAAKWRFRDRSHSVRWLSVTMGVLAMAWVLPAYDEWSQAVGNVDRLAAFWSGDHPRQPTTLALSAWAETLTALIRPRLRPPTGGRLVPVGDVGVVVAGGVLVALLIAAAFLARRRTSFLSSLSALSATGAIVALLSVSGIRGEITDYSLFWMSMVGLVGVACLVAIGMELACSRFWQERHDRRASRIVLGVFTVPLLTAAVLGGHALVRSYAGTWSGSGHSTIPSLAHAVDVAARATASRRVQVNIVVPVWEETAGVILELYKRGVPVSVDPGLSIVYGRPLTREKGDMALWFLDSALADQFHERGTGCVVHEEGRVVIYSMTVTAACAPANVTAR